MVWFKKRVSVHWLLQINEQLTSYTCIQTANLHQWLSMSRNLANQRNIQLYSSTAPSDSSSAIEVWASPFQVKSCHQHISRQDASSCWWTLPHWKHDGPATESHFVHYFLTEIKGNQKLIIRCSLFTVNIEVKQIHLSFYHMPKWCHNSYLSLKILILFMTLDPIQLN